MALVPHRITALAKSDAEGTGGQNIVAGASVSMFDDIGNAITLYDDENGTNGSTAKTTDSSGQVVVWVTPGEYRESVNGSTLRRVTVGGKSATEVGTFADLQLYRPTKEGQAFICQERGNAKYAVQDVGYIAKSKDVTFSNGRVGEYISQPAGRLFSSVSEMKEYEGFGGESVRLESYHEGLGIGGGELVWDASSTEPDNGGTIFQVTGVNTGRWVRKHGQEVFVSWFGAKGDASRPVANDPLDPPSGTDDTAAIKAAVTYVQDIAFQPNLFVGFWGGYTLCFEPNRAYRVSGDNVLGTTKPRNTGVSGNPGQLARQNYWVDGKGCFFLWEVTDENDRFIESHETFVRQEYHDFSVYACLVTGAKGVFYSNIAIDGGNATTIHKFDRVEVYHSVPQSETDGLKYMFCYEGTNLGDRLITERCSFNQAHTFFYSENLEAVQQSFRGTTFASYIDGCVFFHLRRHGSGFNFSSGTGFLMKGDNQTLFKTEFLPGSASGINGSTVIMDVTGCRLENSGGKLQTIADCDFGVLDIKGVIMTAGGLPADESYFCKTRDTGVVIFRSSQLHGRVLTGTVDPAFDVYRGWAVKMLDCMFTLDICQNMYTEKTDGSIVNIREGVVSDQNYYSPAILIEDSHTGSINWQGRPADSDRYVFSSTYSGMSIAPTHNVSKKIMVGRFSQSAGFCYLPDANHAVMPSLTTITSMKITHPVVNASLADELIIKAGSAEITVPLGTAKTNEELLNGQSIVISDTDKAERQIVTELRYQGGASNTQFVQGIIEVEYRQAMARNEITTAESGGVRLTRVIG